MLGYAPSVLWRHFGAGAPTRSPRDLALCSADTPSSTAPIDQANCHPVGRWSTGNCGIAAWSTRSIGPHGLPVPTSCKAQFTRHHAVLQRTVLCSTLLTGRAAHNPLREGFPAPHRPPTASMTECEADGLYGLSRVPWAGSPVLPMHPLKHTPSSTRVSKKGGRHLKSAPQWPTLARSYLRHTEYGKDLAGLMPLLRVIPPGPLPIYQSMRMRKMVIGVSMPVAIFPFSSAVISVWQP